MRGPRMSMHTQTQAETAQPRTGIAPWACCVPWQRRQRRKRTFKGSHGLNSEERETAEIQRQR